MKVILIGLLGLRLWQIRRLGGLRLRCEWREIRFGDILEGSTRNGIYKPKEYHGRGNKIINMGELFAHPRLPSIPMQRVELTGKEQKAFNVLPGDLLFARRSLVIEGAGKCSIVMAVDENTTFESSIIRARPKKGDADSLFLYYYFLSPVGRLNITHQRDRAYARNGPGIRKKGTTVTQ